MKWCWTPWSYSHTYVLSAQDGVPMLETCNMEYNKILGINACFISCFLFVFPFAFFPLHHFSYSFLFFIPQFHSFLCHLFPFQFHSFTFFNCSFFVLFPNKSICFLFPSALNHSLSLSISFQIFSNPFWFYWGKGNLQKTYFQCWWDVKRVWNISTCQIPLWKPVHASLNTTLILMS